MKNLFTLICMTLVITTYGQTTDGLVAYYPLDGNADDLSGNNNNGVIMGTVVPAADRDGKANSAMEFDGSTGYITIPSSPTLSQMTTEMSVTAWVNFYQWSLGWGPILCKSDTADLEAKYRFVLSSTLGFGFEYEGEYSTLTHSFNLNEWMHVAAVYQMDSTRYYFNGNYIGIMPNNTPSKPYDSTLVLEIGRDVPYVTEYTDGVLDEIRIYNRALTDADVAEIHNPSSGGPTGIAGPGQPSFDIYPNPAGSQLFIAVKDNKPFERIRMINLTGQVVLDQPFNRQPVDVYMLRPGIYQVNITGKNIHGVNRAITIVR